MLIFLVLFFPASSFGSGIDEYISRIQNAYRGIKDLRGSFVQKSTIRDLNRTDVYKGDFLIKYPLKMKWSYNGKSAQGITINNDTVLIYREGDSQAYRAKFDRASYGQTPVALLTGFGDIRNEFNISGTSSELILVPKNPMGNITSIKLRVAEEGFPIQAFTIQDGISNIIEIEIKNIRINTGLKDSLFELRIPDGVSVFDQSY